MQRQFRNCAHSLITGEAMYLKKLLASFAAIALVGTAAQAIAQSATDEINKYREMISDGNPAELYEADGEGLWKTPAGPKNATLEKCDLGLGAGVVKGAAAQLPRYFKDTGKVQDLESRLMTCMETLQGIDPKEIIAAPFGKGAKKSIEAVVAYVVTNSRDMKINVVPKHPKEKEMYELGKHAFYYRGGVMDFACASCHDDAKKRIRLQDLPDITSQKGAALAWGFWPAYRVSSGEFWTMQRRINDCYRQQRFPFPIYGSDVTIALSMYMAANANGGVVKTPGLKR
ncbi:L-cysteine S-thiosulfotransferase subunit SoxA [Gammaproteobacteria bacterium]